MIERTAASMLDRVVEPGVPRVAAVPLIGALPGEGIGAEIFDAALEVVRRLEDAGGHPVAVEFGGPIGREAERLTGTALPDEVAEFCSDVLGRGGAILNGPGGGRYVYDLRRRLDLFVKVSPVRPLLAEASPLRPEVIEGVDLLVVRENLGGVYQGRSAEAVDGDGSRAVRHDFSYREGDVRRFLDAAARLAGGRRGELTVVIKDAGLPTLSALWRACALASAEANGVVCSFVDVDLMAYDLVRRPQRYDVVAAPNMFGDVLGDLAGVLLGGRELSFGASFTPGGGAVYQTNHGAAHDIAGTGTANPIGQILSLAMLLRESLNLEREARCVEAGVRRGLHAGVAPGEMGALVAEAAVDELAARAA